MMHLATHMQKAEGSTIVGSFTVAALGCEWLQRGINRPVSYQGLNKPDTTGVGLQEQDWGG
jgi:hypothetical protein